jgi:DNA-binding CsgD family transcriptional regulator
VWIPIARRLPDPLFVPSDHISTAAVQRTEFYADWLRPAGIDNAIGGFVRRSDAAISMFTLARGAEPVEPGERREFARLLPHVRRAVEIHRRLAMTRLARDGAVDALNALNIGVLLIDANCRVAFANPVAEAILRNGDALRAIGGMLQAATSDVTQRLAALVRLAVQTTARRGDDAGGVLLLPTPRGKPLRVMVSPAPRFPLIEPSALVFLGDPNAASDPDRRIARLYGLTTAETRLLGALFAGQRLKDYAEASSISVNTAKFHLKNIFGKTGSTGQMDLQRLVGNDPVLHLAAARSVTKQG